MFPWAWRDIKEWKTTNKKVGSEIGAKFAEIFERVTKLKFHKNENRFNKPKNLTTISEQFLVMNRHNLKFR